ncbi:hypothetical protein K437DRAFT_18975 [Tilletiaria anomala UBC 951]|uniref:Uncharacterized protein n=1 Tax=Tilletiaria anomala (strain ATCC 24038 / CBS 436.72 / UBC 951) TaxID=1037660 RepID=A0A066VJM6_TILAU|nr:uncharacterized protein K437DRAFT_18975 [Tilletiaria anomala UBC 951]KDN38934.1 hypothetical protein K437DRAFT_18975 [Tilletiaria anomala UBC 951]
MRRTRSAFGAGRRLYATLTGTGRGFLNMHSLTSVRTLGVALLPFCDTYPGCAHSRTCPVHVHATLHPSTCTLQSNPGPLDALTAVRLIWGRRHAGASTVYALRILAYGHVQTTCTRPDHLTGLTKQHRDESPLISAAFASFVSRGKMM